MHGMRGEDGKSPRVSASGTWEVWDGSTWVDTGIAAGTGETALPAVNVKAGGAKGDGVTDDTAAIQAAIDALPAGGTLYFPTGVYRVRNLALKSHMTVCGDGFGSVIQLLDGLTGTNYQNCLTVNDVTDVTIRSLKLDGRRATQTSTGTAQDQRLNGIHVKGASDVRIENVWLYNNGYHGIHGISCERVSVRGCLSTDNGFRPIHFHTGCADILIADNAAKNNGLGVSGGSGNLYDGIFVFDIQRCVIANNTVYCNREGGISAAGNGGQATGATSDLTIVGNTIMCAAKTAPDTGLGSGNIGSAGMYLAMAGLHSFTISGNSVSGGYYGIYLLGTSAAVGGDGVISDNAIDNCVYGVATQLNIENVSISGNTIRNCDNVAVLIARSRNVKVTNNIISADSDIEDAELKSGAVTIQAADDCVFTENLINANNKWRYGFRVYDARSGYLGTGNIFGGNFINGAAVSAFLFQTEGNVQRSNWIDGVNDTPIPDGLPVVTEQDNGKFLRVVSGAWAAQALTDVSEVGA